VVARGFLRYIATKQNVSHVSVLLSLSLSIINALVLAFWSRAFGSVGACQVLTLNMRGLHSYTYQ
jgi:hypothetical protein